MRLASPTFPCKSLLSVALIVLSAQTIWIEPPMSYHIERRFVFDSGRAGLLAIDARNRRLYGADHFVIDIDRDSIVGQLPLKSGHGFAFAEDLGLGVTRLGVMFDLHTLAVRDRLDLEGYSVAYDKMTHRLLFVGSSINDHYPAVMTAYEVDASTGKTLFKFMLPDEPKIVVSDGAGSFLTDIIGLHSVLKIDAQTAQVTATWKPTGCEFPEGLAIDVAHSRLFASCYHTLTILDSRDGHVVASIPTGVHNADEIAFDSDAQLLFHPNGDGTMLVVHEDSPDRYRVVGTVTTAEGAQVAAVDPQSHKAFLPFNLHGGGFRVLVLAPRAKGHDIR